MATRLQLSGGAQTVAVFAVLAELRFRFDAFDLDFDADDRAHHGVEVIGGRVAHLPGLGIAGARFMRVGQARDHLAHIFFVITQAQTAVHMHHLIIPGRHVAMGFRLARIPVGRDVRLGPSKNDEHWRAVGDRGAKRIGPGHMRAQTAVRPRVAVVQKRQMIGIEPARAVHHQGPERMGVEQGADGVAAVLVEMRWGVHGRWRRARAEGGVRRRLAGR